MTDFEKLKIVRGKNDSWITQLEINKENTDLYNTIFKLAINSTIEDLEAKIKVLNSQIDLIKSIDI